MSDDVRVDTFFRCVEYGELTPLAREDLGAFVRGMAARLGFAPPPEPTP